VLQTFFWSCVIYKHVIIEFLGQFLEGIVERESVIDATGGKSDIVGDGQILEGKGLSPLCENIEIRGFDAGHQFRRNRKHQFVLRKIV